MHKLPPGNNHPMYQVTFSKQSASIFKCLHQDTQMQLMDYLSRLDITHESLNNLGKIIRDKKTYYRIRWQDLRIYFECSSDDNLTIHFLLPKHTWNDFLFRTKLPFNEEIVEKDNQFWTFLENLKK